MPLVLDKVTVETLRGPKGWGAELAREGCEGLLMVARARHAKRSGALAFAARYLARLAARTQKEADRERAKEARKARRG